MLKNQHRQWHRPAHSPSRSGRAILAAAALACTLFAGPIHAAAEAKPSPQTPQREQLTISPEEAMKPWTGDLDGMIERRVIRVLTVYSKTFYFVDKGVQRGADLRHVSPVRGGSEQETGQGEEAEAKASQGAGGVHSGRSGRTAAGAGCRQGRYRGGQPHGYRRAPEAG